MAPEIPLEFAEYRAKDHRAEISSRRSGRLLAPCVVLVARRMRAAVRTCVLAECVQQIREQQALLAAADEGPAGGE
jgi:hypothetical protein